MKPKGSLFPWEFPEDLITPNEFLKCKIKKTFQCDFRNTFFLLFLIVDES